MEGLILLLMVVYFVFISKSWYWIILYAAVSNIIFLAIAIWFLPESPKWLYDQKRYVDCVRVLKKMANFNGEKDLGKIHMLLNLNNEQDGSNQEILNPSGARSSLNGEGDLKDFEIKSPYKIIMADKQMFRNVIGMIMLWTSASFGYYLIGYQLKYIEGDFFINNVTSQITEIFANIASGAVFKFLGLNVTITISYILSLSGMLCLTFSSTKNQGLLSLFILGTKWGICQMFNIGYVGNTHLFPISVVATSYGLCNLFARGSSILAPLVAELKPEAISKWCFSGLMIIGLVITSIIRDPKRKQKVKQKEFENTDKAASWKQID